MALVAPAAEHATMSSRPYPATVLAVGDDDLTRLHRVPSTDDLRRRCFAILNEAQIADRQSRCDLAEWVLRRDVETWSDLSRYEWSRLTDALVGWESVRELRRQSGLLKD